MILSCMLLASACSDKKAPAGKTADIDTIPMMVMQIQKCSRLYTAEYNIHKIITHDDRMKIKGTFMQKDFNITLPVGERKIAIPMDATLKAYIDFGDFTEKNIHRKGEKIEIILPDPKVELTSSRINHNDIKKHVALLRSGFTDEELTGYERQGRESIVNSIPQMGIIEMAEESAANVLIPMIEQMGYSQNNITVTFRKKFTADDLPFIITKKSSENGK